MSKLTDEFLEIRKKGTPFVLVLTPDYRVSINEMMNVRRNGETAPPMIQWDICQGHRPLNDAGQKAINVAYTDMETQANPVGFLVNATELPEETVAFFIIPKQDIIDNESVIQGIANIRDKFKDSRRTLVLLARDLKLPGLIREDVPVIQEELPGPEAIKEIAERIHRDVGITPKDGDISKAVDLCRGLTAFAVEEGISRKLRKSGLDLKGLGERQRIIVESSTDKALAFERGGETFADVGGIDQIKTFAKRLLMGSNPPAAIIMIEEIEKAMAGIGSGGVGDSSGTSQDQLGVLLDEMETNNWTGLISVGVSGAGKSLISKTMGNSFGVPSLKMDMGAMKSKWVGSSEESVRRTMSVIKSFAGQRAFFIATSNNLSIIPPELRRRFRYGVWFFDLPTKEEREPIWAINLKRYGLDAKAQRPDDIGWTGADIRNVCELSSRLSCSLIEATDYIVPVCKSDPQAIERLRQNADGKFLSASYPGTYDRQRGSKGDGKRKMTV